MKKIPLRKVNDLQTLLTYLSEQLHWPIDDDYLLDVEGLFYGIAASELGIKEEEFSNIRAFWQLRPLQDEQPWGIYAVDFSSKKLEVMAMRKILSGLLLKRRPLTTNIKKWKQDRILFLCLWGEQPHRTIGIACFQAEGTALPSIKVLNCTPTLESRAHLENFESKLRTLEWPSEPNHTGWIEQWGRLFAPKHRQVIRDTIQLTEALASVTTDITSILKQYFSIESSEGAFHQLYQRFSRTLHISLSEDEFADMYSQTIVYGLFSARCMCPEETAMSVATAIKCLPKTNPLLKELLQECCMPNHLVQFDEIDLSELLSILNKADIKSILSDFNRQTGYSREDPIIYFYERFLATYKKEEQKRKGVYYTPAPVVNFLVDAVSYLLKNEYGCPYGFLESEISVLDPVIGTGTFLRSVILTCHEEYQKKNCGDSRNWSQYVSSCLLNRLYGMEILMAPYAIAHMKLAMVLQETGYDFQASNRIRVYLANSLECSQSHKEEIVSTDPLEIESRNAEIIRERKINVILGNPPYRVESANKGKWIMQLMKDYKLEPDKGCKLIEKNSKVINDDYVKFVRFAQETVKNEDNAIIAYIIPHSFTDNVTFRGMRWSLLHNFQSIYILDLHGNVMAKEREGDKNIFDIQQGVAICLFCKKTRISADLAKVYYASVYGSQEDKYHYLSTTKFSDVEWTAVIPKAPRYYFKPMNLINQDSYRRGIQLSELFPESNGGVKTHADSTLISFKKFDNPFNQLYDYRPFDVRYINYDRTKVQRDRYDTMRHFINKDNYGIVINRQVVNDNWSHIQIVRNIIDNRLHRSRKGITSVCPMFLYEDGKAPIPNINRVILSRLTENIKETFSERLTSDSSKFDILNVFDYCYGVLSSNLYRLKYKDLLSIDFPRVPVPTSSEMFRQISRIGAKLRELHLMTKPIANELNIAFLGIGDNVISTVSLVQEGLKINKKQHFSNITSSLWTFPFGGYQGLNKWFKDRRGCKLDEVDIKHVIDVFNVFAKSKILMEQADQLLIQYNVIDA